MPKLNLDMATPKPSVLSFVLIGLMAVLFIALAKMLDAKYSIPGFHDVIQMV